MSQQVSYAGQRYFLKLFFTFGLLGFLPVLFPLTQLSWPGDSSEVLRMSGILSGIAGLSFLALSAFCTLRHPWSERLTRGLDNLYRLHHLVALVAVAFIILHISLLAFSSWLYSPAAAAYLFRFWEQPWELVLGWASIALLSIVALAAVSLKRAACCWRLLHMLSLPAYLFALYHFHAFTTSTGAAQFFLYTFFIGGFCAGLLRSLKYLFSCRYCVTTTEHLADDVIRIALLPEGKPLRYQAGQYVFAAFHTACGYSGCNEFHPFTITSVPGEETLELIVKARGDCSCTLQHIVPGVPANIEGPFGGLKIDSSAQVWIGGGIGITPLLSLLKSTASQAPAIDIYYLARSEAEHVLLGQLRQAARGKPEITIYAICISEDAAQLMEIIKKNTPDFRERSFLLGGPPQMVQDVERCLTSLGIKRSRMQHESFGNI